MWREDLLEKYIAFMEQNQDYICCFCIPELIDENDSIIENENNLFHTENHTRENWFKLLYANMSCLCAPSVCMRKAVKERLGVMRYQYRQLQDYE